MLLKTLRDKKQNKLRNWQLPAETQSLCPVCLKVIAGLLYVEDGRVMMDKNCPEHGAFKELVSGDAEFFLKMRRTHYERPSAIENPHSKNTSGCPQSCGLCEQHASRPAMVNIDLTNRCNMNCPICFANSNATGRICELTLEQVKQMLRATAEMKPRGPSCLQFAGGEPTIHKDFVECVREAKKTGLEHVQVASNGLKFAKSFEFCQAASEAGLDQVYLQFDGLSDDIYEKARGRALLDVKLQAVENIGKANIRVVLVPTIVKGLNDDQVGRITRFAVDNVDIMSGISWQPVSITGRIDESKRLQMRYTLADLARDLQEQCGFLDMHRDWWPFSIVSPFLRLMTAVKGEPQFSVSCHPHCGAATYIVVDKQTKKVVPLPAFIDIELAMATLDKIANRIEKHPWLKSMSVVGAMRAMKKYFYPELAPEGWGFEKFLEFVGSFVDFTEQHADKAAYKETLEKQRCGTLILAAMHFQDVYNYEIDRTNHCVILYAAPNGRFYPFCTWNSGPCHRYKIEKAFSRPAQGITEVSTDHASKRQIPTVIN